MPTPEVVPAAAFNRLRRLPEELLDVWELAVVRLPQWMPDDEGRLFRAWAMIAVSRERRAGAMGQLALPHELAALDPVAALDQLSRERDMAYRPTRVAVSDPVLADRVRVRLEPLGIAVEVASELREVAAFMRAASEHLLGEPEPGYLAAPGVDLGRVRALADAAMEFARAAPWNDLSDLDRIEVESATPEAGFDSFVVTGGVGVVRGVLFFSTPDEHALLLAVEDDDPAFREPRWAIGFRPLPELAMADADLWEDHGLPLAPGGLAPWFSRESEQLTERPDADQLAFGEGLLRALAATTEDELDAGRWTKRVRTSAGEREYVLALPGVLDPPPVDERGDPHFNERILAHLSRLAREEGVQSETEMQDLVSRVMAGRVPRPEPRTPAEQATDLLVAAWGSEGRQQIKLARRAIATWPDCADAHVLLAMEMPDLGRAHALASQGVRAGERALGPEAFRDHVGHFWSILETRPYMRALQLRAELAADLEWADEAIADWGELLRLDPGDHLGVRESLAPYLLECGRDGAAAELLDRYAADESAMLSFSRALLAFRVHGAGAAADAALARANRANRHVLKYLIDAATPRDVRDDRPHVAGGEHEAVLIDDALGVAFEDTPGATEWLRQHRRGAKKSREAKRRKK